MRRRLASFLVLAALWLAGADLHGQDTDDGAHWQTSVHYLQYQIQELDDWRSVALIAGRVTPGFTALAEVESAERVGEREITFGGEVYVTLAGGAYTNVRARISPGAETVPRLMAAADAILPLGRAWEAWLGVEQREYPLRTVRTLGVGPGVYVGTWYVRARPTISWGGGESTLVGKVVGRRLFEDSPANYIEIGGGYGSEFVEMVPTAGGGVDIDAQQTWIASARGQVYLTRRMGVSVGGTYQDYEEIGARPSFTVGVLGRW